jgi:hypothetical protein
VLQLDYSLERGNNRFFCGLFGAFFIGILQGGNGGMGKNVRTEM